MILAFVAVRTAIVPEPLVASSNWTVTKREPRAGGTCRAAGPNVHLHVTHQRHPLDSRGLGDPVDAGRGGPRRVWAGPRDSVRGPLSAQHWWGHTPPPSSDLGAVRPSAPPSVDQGQSHRLGLRRSPSVTMCVKRLAWCLVDARARGRPASVLGIHQEHGDRCRGRRSVTPGLEAS